MKRAKRKANGAETTDSQNLIRTGADLRKVLATIMVELAAPNNVVSVERREQLRLAVKAASHINESFGVDLRAAHILIEAKKANILLNDMSPIGTLSLIKEEE